MASTCDMSKSSKQPLTPKQTDFLVSIRALMERNGMPPTLEEMGEFNGVSRDTANAFVRRLVRKGYLERTHGKHRNLRFVK